MKSTLVERNRLNAHAASDVLVMSQYIMLLAYIADVDINV
jgi:hypothetical protein